MRITSLDIIRGISILGILFMNIGFHTNIMFGYVPFEIEPFSDKMVTMFNTVFMDGRFRTLFALIFGVGLAIQYQSSLKKGIDPKIFLKSRLNWLFVFGLIHAIFIFGGDILMLYSLSAYITITALNLNNKSLLKYAKVFIILGSILNIFFAAIVLAMQVFLPEEMPLITRESTRFVEAMSGWYGDYWAQVLQQGGFALIALVGAFFSIIWQIVGFMYLGVYLYRTDFFKTGFSNSTLIKLLIGGVFFTALCFVPQYFGIVLNFKTLPIISSVAAVFVALIYAHIIVKVVNSGSRILNVFIPCGRLAFSLYILQSISMAILLRWIMPEFSQTASLSDLMLIALAATVVQIVIAHIYLRFYTQGPLEALWRKLYLKSVDKKLKAKALAEENLQDDSNNEEVPATPDMPVEEASTLKK